MLFVASHPRTPVLVPRKLESWVGRLAFSFDIWGPAGTNLFQK
jgi:hypothetical protein